MMPRMAALTLATLLCAPSVSAQTRLVANEIAEDIGWTYPTPSRPAPVFPPAQLYEGQSESEVRLGAIMYDPRDAARSRAIVQLGADATTRQVVRVGDSIGRYRVTAIRRRAIVISVRALGTLREQTVEPYGVAAGAAGDGSGI